LSWGVLGVLVGFLFPGCGLDPVFLAGLGGLCCFFLGLFFGGVGVCACGVISPILSFESLVSLGGAHVSRVAGKPSVTKG